MYLGEGDGLIEINKEGHFFPISSSGGVTIFAPFKSFISFTNSPYYSHKHGLAVDIYPSRKANATSPVEGKLLKVFTLKSPRPYYFRAGKKENLLIIQPKENRSLVVRVLHVDYDSGTGDNFTIGEPVGKMVRSGFFDFWTQPHIHVEVRRNEQLLRAKGSLPMTPFTQSSKIIGTPSEVVPKLRIVSVNRYYILVEPLEDNPITFLPFEGFGCKIGKATGILDAGIPYYKYGSVHLEQGTHISIGDKVNLWGIPIGEVVESRKCLATFKSYPINLRLNEEIIKGIALYLWIGRHPLIKVIPYKPTAPNFSKGQIVILNIIK